MSELEALRAVAEAANSLLNSIGADAPIDQHRVGALQDALDNLDRATSEQACDEPVTRDEVARRVKEALAPLIGRPVKADATDRARQAWSATAADQDAADALLGKLAASDARAAAGYTEPCPVDIVAEAIAAAREAGRHALAIAAIEAMQAYKTKLQATRPAAEAARWAIGNCIDIVRALLAPSATKEPTR